MRFSRALRKFLLGYFLLHLVVAAIFLFVLTAWLRDQMLDQTRHRMQDVCYSLRLYLQELPVDTGKGQVLQFLQRLEAETGDRITVIDNDGTVIVDSRTGFEDIGDHGSRPEVVEARKKGIGFKQRKSATLDVPLLYMAMPLFEADASNENQPSGFVRVAVEEKSVFETISALQKFLWVFTIGTGVLASLLMVVFASREMRPLQAFADAARTVASGQYAMMPGIARRDDEWKSLSDAFTVMQSELKQRESRLRENSLRLEAVLGSMIEGVLALSSNKQVLVANQAACEMLGVTQADLVDSNLLDLLRIPELSRAVQHTLLTQAAIQTEFPTTGSPRRVLEVRVAPLSDQREFGAAIVMYDVTELRALETMRRDFVANVSHELKTPLASIKAYAETLRLGAIDDKEHNIGFVEQIEEQADTLDHQIADLLKLSELESGLSTFDPTEIDMVSVFQKCRDRFQVEADLRNLTINIDTSDKDCVFVVDRIALRTVLDNLVSNAIRYARPSGEVRLTAICTDERYSFSVMDNGIGISTENQDRIFERFFRVDYARSRDLGGTGLGLSIVKHTVNAMGGNISVHSKPGQGSTFEISFPVKPGLRKSGTTEDEVGAAC